MSSSLPYTTLFRSRRLQQRQRTRPDLGPRRLQRGDQVRPERDRMVVSAIEREPGRDRASAGRGQPLGQERRLAEAGGRGDEGQLGLRTAEQALRQAWSRDQAATGLRGVEL